MLVFEAQRIFVSIINIWIVLDCYSRKYLARKSGIKCKLFSVNANRIANWFEHFKLTKSRNIRLFKLTKFRKLVDYKELQIMLIRFCSLHLQMLVCSLSVIGVESERFAGCFNHMMLSDSSVLWFVFDLDFSDLWEWQNGVKLGLDL